MAGRNLRELEAELYLDHRYHLGTLHDFTESGQDGAFVAGQEPTLGDAIGAGGLIYDNADCDKAVQLAAVTMSGVFAWEAVVSSRSAGGANAGRIVNAASLNLRWNGANIFFDCGTTLQTALDQPFTGTIIATRDSSDDGYIYANGVPLISGAVGSGSLSAHVVTIGNSTGWNRAFDGVIHALRLYSTYIDPDEAAVLHEASRIALWPGAPKRSGIVTP